MTFLVTLVIMAFAAVLGQNIEEGQCYNAQCGCPGDPGGVFWCTDANGTPSSYSKGKFFS
jgi:hypothetical protein